MTVISLFSFATCNYVLFKKIGSNKVETIMKWSSLIFSSLLVFSVQLGVQTMPNLLSGELFPSNVRSKLKGITRSIQCVLLVSVLQVIHSASSLENYNHQVASLLPSYNNCWNLLEVVWVFLCCSIVYIETTATHWVCCCFIKVLYVCKNKPFSKINCTTLKEYCQTSKKCWQFKNENKIHRYRLRVNLARVR